MWENHFQSEFHAADTATIVANPSIRTLLNIPKFFVNPALSSTKQAQVVYEPLLYSVFSIDYAIAGHADPAMFQFQIFVWFCFAAGMIYLVFRLIPDGDHYSALFAAVLFALHPLAANTFNEPLHLDVAIGTFALLGGLAIALVWPQRLPAEIRLGAPKVPKSEWDLFRLKAQPKVTRWWHRIQRRRLGLYMIPVIFGLLAFPDTAVFVPILAVFMLLYEPEKGLRRLLYPGIICGGYWLLQTIFTWKYAGHARVPLVDFWITQPLVILRSFFFFFVPFHMEGVSTLQPVEHFFSPWALAGIAGTAVLVVLAAMLSKSNEWRAVGFGLWWFLIASASASLVPQTQVETYPHMVFASVGLALAVSRAAQILGARLTEGKDGQRSLLIPTIAAGLVLGLVVLSAWGQQTWKLNEVWKSDESLWKDAITRFPDDGVALTSYATILMRQTDNPDFFDIRLDEAYGDLKKATALMPHNPEAMIQLALASQRKLLEADSGDQLRAAIRMDPNYASAHAWYARWLLDRGRTNEAMVEAKKAIDLDPSTVVGWQAVADVYIANSDWKSAIDAGTHTLQVDPDSNDGHRSLQVAQTGMAARQNAELATTKSPSVDAWLTLAVVYYNEKRYQDCINASKAALKMDPSIGEAWVNIASAYHELGNHEEGLAALREAARLRPDFDYLKGNIDWELAHLKDGSGSEKH